MSIERKEIERRKRPPFANGYSVRQVAKLLELTPTQVHSFVRAGFLSPRRGPSAEYRFTFQDLVVLRTAKELSGRLSPRKVKRALRSLKQQLPLDRDLTAVRITSVGDEIVVKDGRLAWIPESGQTLLDFGVAELANQVAPLVHRAVRVARSPEEQMQAEDWYELGCELEDCEPEQAIEAYDRAAGIDPRHVDALINMGRLLHERGDLRGAESRYRMALEVEPNDATAAYNLGVLLQDLSRPLEAAKAYERALQADPEHVDAHYNLAHLYEQLGRSQSAVRHLQIYRQLTSHT